MSNQDLIVVKQLPIIQEQLKTLSTEIDEKVENAKSLICTEETVKEVKQVRADLNKEFKDLEIQRKLVKEQVLAPYMKFEEIYKQCVSDKYKNADIELKNKVDSIENELKLKKEQEIKDYFEEYKTVNNIDFITYEQAKINVTLSASMKNLKEQAKMFIDKVVDDLNLIETQEHKAEILVEYKQTLNVSNAITTVTNRFKAIEEENKKQIEKQNRIIEEMEDTIIIQAEEKNNSEFKIFPSKNKITIILNITDEQKEKIKQFLELSNIEYESEDL